MLKQILHILICRHSGSVPPPRSEDSEDPISATCSGCTDKVETAIKKLKSLIILLKCEEEKRVIHERKRRSSEDNRHSHEWKRAGAELKREEGERHRGQQERLREEGERRRGQQEHLRDQEQQEQEQQERLQEQEQQEQHDAIVECDNGNKWKGVARLVKVCRVWERPCAPCALPNCPYTVRYMDPDCVVWTQQSGPPSPSPHLSPGAIAGITIAVVVVVVMCGAATTAAMWRFHILARRVEERVEERIPLISQNDASIQAGYDGPLEEEEVLREIQHAEERVREEQGPFSI